jgi:hypothetical protein
MKCKVKESDVMLINYITPKDSKDTAEKYRKPIRAVMNLNSITLYETPDYYTNLASFSLKLTDIVDEKYQGSICFRLKEYEKSALICPFDMLQRDSNFVDEWLYDFHLFKNKCPQKKEDLTKKIEAAVEKKMEKIKEDMNNEKLALITEKNKENEISKQAAIMAQTTKIALEAMKKEAKMEDLIKKEEQLKEEANIKSLEEQIEKEEKKEENLKTCIKQKELESETILATQEEAKRIAQIQKEAAQKLLESRDKLKLSLNDMKKKSSQKESKLKAKLMQIRAKIASETTNAYKKGDTEKCKPGIKSKTDRVAYCDANYSTNYTGYLKCTDETDYCYACCESEFGQMYIDLRKQCVQEICS